MNETYKARLSLIPLFAEKHKAHHIGRTALMKYMYFLQTLRDVPLGYHFSMYSYGPFDSDVLADLSSAEAMKIVTSTPVLFSGGYGYEIRPAPNAEAIKNETEEFLCKHKDDIDWLFAEFGDMNSADLELASTVVFVDREFNDEPRDHDTAEIAARVSEIKPHFSKDDIQKSVDSLSKRGLIASTGAGIR